MKIVNLMNQEIKAAFQFNYKGFLVSASTILDKHGHIMAFKDETSLTGNTIEDVLKNIDKYLENA